MGGFGLIFTARMAYFVPFLIHDANTQENDNCPHVDYNVRIGFGAKKRAARQDWVIIEL
jgi:hypothetical protein